MNSGMTKKLLWAVFLSLSFMALLLYGVDWTHFSSIVDRLKINVLFAAFGALLLANLVRSWRFYMLDHSKKNKFTSWLIINKLYNWLTATLPGGVGEVATVYLIKRYSFFNMLSAFRILLLSRVMDLTAVSALLLFAAIQVKGDGYYHETILWIAIVLLFISIASVIPASERFILKLMKKLPGQSRLMKSAREKMNELSVISEEHSGRNILGITLIQSALVIIAVATSLHLILISCDTGFTLMQSFYCYTLYAVLQIIPIQGIAGIGTQPARWAVALNMAGYKAHDVVALSIILHVTLYVFISIMGLSALLIWQISRKTSIA